MERMLVALFNDEEKAREGSQALQAMGDEGEVAVHTIDASPASPTARSEFLFHHKAA
jgi:hypothetical protein